MVYFHQKKQTCFGSIHTSVERPAFHRYTGGSPPNRIAELILLCECGLSNGEWIEQTCAKGEQAKAETKDI